MANAAPPLSASSGLHRVRSFVAAIKESNLTRVQQHAESGIFSEKDLDQALFFSAFLGRQELVRYFLERDWPFLDKDRALQAAASAGQTRTLIQLRQFGADPRFHEDFPFHLSVTRNRAVTSAYLVLDGADAQGSAQRSVQKAFASGLKELALDCVGFQAYAGNPDRALEWAVRNQRDTFALAAVLGGANANLNEGELALVAASNGSVRLLRLLCHYGADILAQGEDVAKQVAIRSNNREVLRAMADLVKMARTRPTVLPPSERTREIKAVQGSVEFVKGIRIRPRRMAA